MDIACDQAEKQPCCEGQRGAGTLCVTVTLSRQILKLAKTRGELTVREIDESTGANPNTIKTHLRILALFQTAGIRGANHVQAKGIPESS
jgi:hypothetical protein